MCELDKSCTLSSTFIDYNMFQNAFWQFFEKLFGYNVVGLMAVGLFLLLRQIEIVTVAFCVDRTMQKSCETARIR